MRSRAVASALLCLALAACAENQGASVVGAVDAGPDVASTADAPGIDAADVPAPEDRPAPADAPDVPGGCSGDAACAATPGRPVCDLATGRCVACTAASDRCPAGSWCAATDLCAEGCRDDDACGAAGGDGGAAAGRCDPTTHRCVACVRDEHCPAGSLCVGAVCVPGCSASRACPAGQSCCGGGCVSTQENVAHCGACGANCVVPNAAPACLNGTCGVGACTAPHADCDREAANGCEANTQSDVAHCGACGSACAARANSAARCEGGGCRYACAAGFADCDGDPANGCEVDTRASVAHCGACGRRCDPANAAAGCAAGACVVASCATGYGDCDGNATNGCEVDTGATPAHCGGCGMACAPRPNALVGCASATCVLACLAGFADCDGDATNGCEVDTRTTVASCGSCGRACRPANATGACVAAQCRVAACAAGFGDCDGDPDDGCEVDTRVSPAHCGGCGAACPARSNATPTCAGAACGFACAPGFADCDGVADNGCEVDTRANPAHCGACRSACASGVCAASACQPPRCDDGVRNGAETDVDCGGGTCGACRRCGACALDRDCADGACGAQARCTVRRDLSVSWTANCRGPGGGNAAVTAAGLPAGTYEVTPLRSAATVWNPSSSWFWYVTCDNLAVPNLRSPGDATYATPEAAWATVAGRSERVPFAGGDLVCAFADNPCSDNQGAVAFRVELVCP